MVADAVRLEDQASPPPEPDQIRGGHLRIGGRRPYWLLTALCALGIVARAVVMFTYSSAVFVFQNGDSIRYARIAAPGYHSGLFSDPAAPAGYSAFLELMRTIWSALDFTVGVQHLLGIAAALVLYAAMRAVNAPRGFAVVPAGVVLLSGDQIFLEQSLLTETLWSFLVAAGLSAAIRARRGAEKRWLAIAGALLAASALMRQISLVLVPVAAVWGVAASRARGSRRLSGSACLALAAVGVIGSYVAIAHAEHGSTGLGGQGGFQLYGRVAQFADCADFKPPGRTRLLCQTIPGSRRSGPTQYLFGANEPLLTTFHARLPQDDHQLGQFALDAIENQPLAYLGAVASDWATAAGMTHERAGEGADPATMRFSATRPYGSPAPTELDTARYYELAYTGVRATPLAHWAQRLGSYQGLFRVHEVFVIPLLVIALAGGLLSAADTRAAIGLLLASSLVLYLFPPVLALWDVRYGVLPGELLVAGASLGAWVIATRFSWSRSGSVGSGAGSRSPRR